jgi:hypothetical protein
MARAFADIDAELESWSARVGRIGKSIEMLSQSASFLRLKAQTRLDALTGASKARGAVAVAALDQTWALYLSLDQTLSRAEDLRAGKNPFTVESRYAEIETLLKRHSVTPPPESASLANLALDAGPERKLALADVVAAMETAFNAARDIVAAAERGWASVQSLEPFRARLEKLAAEAQTLRFAAPLQLGQVRAALDAAAKSSDADPLGADQSATSIASLLDAADAALASARGDAATAKAFLDSAEARLNALAALRAETEDVRAKRLAAVADPPPEQAPPAETTPALRAWLERLREAFGAGRARAVSVGGKSWLAQIEADEAMLKACRDADRKILAARDDLRGRFSALKARADDLATQGRLGAESATLMTETGDLLFGRPTPLPQAVQLLRRCERI